MANVYSKALWSLTPSVAGGNTGPTVPAGVVWDVRQVLLLNSTFSDRAVASYFRFGSQNLPYIYARWRGMNRGNRLYTWQGRCIIEPGDNLVFVGHNGGWFLTVMGYELTLP